MKSNKEQIVMKSRSEYLSGKTELTDEDITIDEVENVE